METNHSRVTPFAFWPSPTLQKFCPLNQSQSTLCHTAVTHNIWARSTAEKGPVISRAVQKAHLQAFYHTMLGETTAHSLSGERGSYPLVSTHAKPPGHGPSLARLSARHAYAFGRRELTTFSITVLCQLAKENTDAREANYLPTGKKKRWAAPMEEACVGTCVSEYMWAGIYICMYICMYTYLCFGKGRNTVKLEKLPASSPVPLPATFSWQQTLFPLKSSKFNFGY